MNDLKVRTADKVNQKLVFDNLHNYALCAGLFAGSRWVTAKIGLPLVFWLICPIQIMAGVMLFLNGFQSLVLAGRCFGQLDGFISKITERYGDAAGLGLYAIGLPFAILLGVLIPIDILLFFGWLMFGPISN